MIEAGEKRLDKTLVGVLSVLVLIIVGLVVGIVLVNIQKKNETMIPEEDWGMVLGECTFDFDTTVVDCVSFRDGLKEIVDTSDNEDTVVMAGISLASLYAEKDIDAATDLLEDIFSDNLSDQNKYRVLKALMLYYKDNNKLKYIEKLREIVELPDSMELENEDWKMIKIMLVSELEMIENSEVDDETQ